jgi:hypothetical protein
MGVAPRDDVRIIRPAAILDERAANRVLDELKRLDISAGGVWNATSSLWQRYDTPWDGMGGTRGNARLLGSIAVMYDAPNRHQITIYKVTVTPYGLESSWAGLTLETCPRAELGDPPRRDPFKSGMVGAPPA